MNKLDRPHFLMPAAMIAWLLTSVGPLPAQAPLPTNPDRGRALVVSVGSTIRLQMRSRKPIKTVFNANPHVLAVRALAGDPTTILITGLQPGIATLELTDAEDRKDAARAAIAP